MTGWHVAAIVAGFIVASAFAAMLIVFDMFGAPHRNKKMWFQFWRSK